MAHANGKITAPVGIDTDIPQVLGVASTDLGYLCSNAHGRINYWSRCKPVRWNSMDVNLTNPNWWKSQNGNCGFLPKMVAGYNTIPDAMDGGLNGWEYQPPLGGNTPYRALDFDGYWHNARPPFSNFAVSPAKIDNKQGSDFGASIMAFIPNGDDLLDELTARDFGLSDYYFGVYVKQDNGQQYRRVTATSSMQSGAISVSIKTYGMPVGDWTVYPFLAQNPIGQDDVDSINQYYTLPNISPAKVQIVASMVSVSVNTTIVDDMGYITWTIRIINNGYGQLNMTNNYIAFRLMGNSFDDPFEIGESQKKLDDFTVAQNETKEITGTQYLSDEIRTKGGTIYVSLKSANYMASTMIPMPMPGQ